MCAACARHAECVSVELEWQDIQAPMPARRPDAASPTSLDADRANPHRLADESTEAAAAAGAAALAEGHCVGAVLTFRNASSGAPVRDLGAYLGASAHALVVGLVNGRPVATAHAHAYPRRVDWYDASQVYRYVSEGGRTAGAMCEWAAVGAP